MRSCLYHLVLQLIFGLCIHNVECSRYTERFSLFAAGHRNFTEGPIWSRKDSPGPKHYTPSVKVEGTFSYVLNSSLSDQREFHPVVIVSSLPQRIPIGEDFLDCEAKPGNGVLGRYQATPMDAFRAHLNFSVDVSKTGWVYVTWSLCSTAELSAGLLVFDGSVTILNAYGYLPALLFGYLAFYGACFVGYALLFCVYTALCICYRKHLLKLQLVILGVMAMGLLETAAWFFTYDRMNRTGSPMCCPVRADITFAFVMTIFKKAVSRLLLLSVSLGFGVVKPSLPRKTTGLVALLGVLYLASSLNYYIRRVVATSSGHPDQVDTGWNLPVAICDVVFIFWIYFSLNQIQKLLQSSGQFVKLGMYQKLARTLGTFVFLWVLYSVFSTLVFYNIIDLSWEYTFYLDGFWDVLYFLLLVVISVVWLPSKRASQYAYSSQLPTEDFDEVSGLEMTGGGSVGSDDEGFTDSYRVENEDIDIDLGIAKPHVENRVESSANQ